MNKSNSKSKDKTYGKVLTEKSLSKDKTKQISANTSKGKPTYAPKKALKK